MTLTEELKHLHITPDPGAIARAQDRWSHVAKPLGSLGVLERNIVRIAGIQADPLIDIEKKALVIMCADNGVVAEGVTQTGQEVTAVVTENFTKGDSCVCLMARRAGTDVFPVDIGVAGEVRDLGVHPLIRRKIRPGTENMAKCPAMTRQEAEAAVRVGMELVGELKSKGYKIIATGEMGIGNTTTSSAVLAALTGCPAAEVTGRGAGLNDEGLERKIRVIDRAIALHRPDPMDGLDVLSKVGAWIWPGWPVCLSAARSAGSPSWWTGLSRRRRPARRRLFSRTAGRICWDPTAPGNRGWSGRLRSWAWRPSSTEACALARGRGRWRFCRFSTWPRTFTGK